jgi:hypothetical protein
MIMLTRLVRPHGLSARRDSPRKIGDIVKAALVQTHFEHDRLA